MARMRARCLWMARRALAAVPALAMAQTGGQASAAEPAQLDEVVVIGTSIKGVAPVGAPVLSISEEAIKQTGLSSTTDIVEPLPQFLSLGADEGRGGLVQNASANIAQGTAINLRGLGTESTLVLVGGRRVAVNGFQGDYLDICTIPAAAPARLEVAPDGASAVYGSNAVAKVGDWATVDANISYSTGDEGSWPLRNLRFTASATNLFDRDPPKVINGVLGFDSQNASPIGRMVSFEVSKAW